MSEQDPRSGADESVPPGMPRWVTVGAIVLGVLVLLFLVLHLMGVGGKPGPQRHMSGMPSPGSGTSALVVASMPPAT